MTLLIEYESLDFEENALFKCQLSMNRFGLAKKIFPSIFRLDMLVCVLLFSPRGLFLVTGFFNIDCGKPEGFQGIDKSTGLQYISDFDLINTGEIHSISSYAYSDLRFDMRAFPVGSRNCYSIPVHQLKKYLLRAYFEYGNYDGKNKGPIFDLYFGSNLWSSINMTTTWGYEKEITVVATSNWMSLCLVNIGSGVPLISGFELRPLADDLYMEANATYYLEVFDRFDAGSIEGLRYPNDTFDRKWNVYRSSVWYGLYMNAEDLSPSNIYPMTISNTDSSIFYDPPAAVMKTAVTTVNGSSLLNLTATWPQSYPIFVIMHFAELEKEVSRAINITKNGEIWSKPFYPIYLKTTSIHDENPRIESRSEFLIMQASGSMMPPILNAVEVFGLINITEPETYYEDVNAIMDVKYHYNITRENWMGDPCVQIEFIWTGLNCSHDRQGQDEGPRIISLNLSSSGLIGEIYMAISNLTELQTLDLSMNHLIGEIPYSLSGLGKLTYLDLSWNNLSGSVPQALLDRVASGALYLRTDGNPNLRTDAEGSNGGKKRILIIVLSSVFGFIMLFIIIFCILCCFGVPSCSKPKPSIPDPEDNKQGQGPNNGGPPEKQGENDITGRSSSTPPARQPGPSRDLVRERQLPQRDPSSPNLVTGVAATRPPREGRRRTC